MNIAFLTDVVYPFVTGGAEKRIHEIGTRLSSRGHDVTIYARHFWDGPTETSQEGMTLKAVAPEADLYTEDRRSIDEALDFSTRLIVPLRKRLLHDEHDLIVASVFPYFPVLSAKLVTLGTDTTLVTTWHEVWRDHWDDYLDYFSTFGKLTERVIANIPQYPIAVSGITANRLADIGPDGDRIEIVPNGIDTEQIFNASPPKQGYNILFAGRLINHKNVDLLLDAFDNIADDYDSTLGIIGDGPERERLEAKHDILTHKDRVEFLGFLDNYEEVLGHMRVADIFVSPSTREGFGITFAEAMAADCTVIAADHPDSAAAEVIGDAGFIVQPTIGNLSSVLKIALDGQRPSNDPVKRARRYDWDAVADQAEEVYRAAIDRTW